MDSQSFTAELIEASPLPLCFREVGVRASQEDMEGRGRGVFMGLVSFKLESCLLGQMLWVFSCPLPGFCLLCPRQQTQGDGLGQ